MANETLEKMQEIETAAEEVLMGYRTQAQELRQRVDEDLRQLGLTYDDETQKLAEELTASSQQKLVLLQQDLVQTTQQKEYKVEAALTDKKADLARAIVEKVEEAYGHQSKAAVVSASAQGTAGSASLLPTGFRVGSDS